VAHGKSYFAKLMIFREFMIGKRQYVFDPEGEYIELIRALKGEVFSFQKKDSNFINIIIPLQININISRII